LLNLDPSEVKIKSINPFRIAPNTERMLIMGERERELKKLESLKYRLTQK